ncbi:unnamed protein product [Timema podura]|uniref:Platelet-derived growth factor receptor-like protein n=1 Tax=Timema podura TaxID=61482 RepID=A0ABN7NBR9_TIMPD|nr:unnamed protein product [Timema podura]
MVSVVVPPPLPSNKELASPITNTSMVFLYDEAGELVVDGLPMVVYNYDGFKYTSQLSVSGANYLYTARYYCQRNDTTQLHPSSAANIYVYVKDDENLIVRDLMNLPFLRVQQHGDVLLPCRPSSPDVKVELLKDSEVVDTISLKEENVEIDYDPTEGITLHHIDIKHSGDYECIARLGDIKTESVPKPMMTDIDEMHVEVGDNVNLNCWVDMGPSIGFSMEWIYPNKNEKNRIFQSDFIASQLNQGKRGQQNITIFSVTHEDEGNYTCQVTDHNKNTNNISKYMKVFDLNTSYNDLVHKGRATVTEYAGNSIMWVVDIIAHPKPNITWYDQFDKEIHTSGNKEISMSGKQTWLKINNVDIDDSGNYSVRSENKHGTKWIHFSLVVWDKPRVEIIGANNFFNQGKRYEIKCKVKGFPAPRVRWFIRYCRIPNECENVDPYIIRNQLKTPCKGIDTTWVQWAPLRCTH